MEAPTDLTASSSPYHVMSKLRWLEELHMAYYPVEDGNNEGLMEIGKLSMLTFLDLFVPHIHLIPKGVFLTKLKGFVIQIGGDCQIYGVVHRKTLILGMNDLDTPSILEVKELIELSDGITFDSVENLNYIVPTMYCESWDDLTTIELAYCDNLLSLVDSSDVDEELGGENTKKQFFSKLEHLLLFRLPMLHANIGISILSNMRMTTGESIAQEIQFDLTVELLPRVKFQDDNVLPRNAIICFHVCLDAQRVFA
ncbi:hypothetical protein Tco_0897855 [Tanacetum coccineum]